MRCSYYICWKGFNKNWLVAIPIKVLSLPFRKENTGDPNLLAIKKVAIFMLFICFNSSRFYKRIQGYTNKVFMTYMYKSFLMFVETWQLVIN